MPGITEKFHLRVQNEAGQRLTELYQENSLVTANTLIQQHKSWLYTWTSSDGKYRSQIDYIFFFFFAAEDGEAVYSQPNKAWSRLWLRSSAPYGKIQT